MSNASQTPTAPAAPSTTWQDRLYGYCRSAGLRAPNYSIISDRRGGRTAWSTLVQVGSMDVQARFWYDGQYVNTAREDAAEVALQRLGQAPKVPAPQPVHQQQQQQYYGAGSPARGP